MKTVLSMSLILFLLSCSTAPAPQGPVFVQEGYALDGYDPVAYFEQSVARKGVPGEMVEYQGFTYLFSSTKNRKLFEANPQAYLPAYGGWCAYAVAETASRMQPDPTQWQIQGGQLQLFYDDWQTSLLGGLKEEWNTDSLTYKETADTNWDQMN